MVMPARNFAWLSIPSGDDQSNALLCIHHHNTCHETCMASPAKWRAGCVARAGAGGMRKSASAAPPCPLCGEPACDGIPLLACCGLRPDMLCITAMPTLATKPMSVEWQHAAFQRQACRRIQNGVHTCRMPCTRRAQAGAYSVRKDAPPQHRRYHSVSTYVSRHALGLPRANRPALP